jgi:hypothetical protein
VGKIVSLQEVILFFEHILCMCSPCIYHVYELINFIKKTEKIHKCSFHSTSAMYKILSLNS